jgi:hypothetical protein
MYYKLFTQSYQIMKQEVGLQQSFSQLQLFS